MSLTIGSVQLSENVILAPMSGVTDLPMRQMVRRFGQHLVVSEMIASDAMTRQQKHLKEVRKMATDCTAEAPMSVQLAGRDPLEFAEAAKMNQDRGAMIIDINMGCPAKKVTGGLAGSALMTDEQLAGRIIEATVKAVSIPVTLKMRLGWNDTTLNAPTLARIAEQAGVQMITVHGRTRCQFYKGKANWTAIRAVKDAITIPLIGNGDVLTEEDALNLLNASGADGVMVGRGIQGRPWFLNQVSHYLKTGDKVPDPDLSSQADLILEHYDSMIAHHGEYQGVRMARKHLGWYSRSLRDAAHFRRCINTLESPAEVKDTVRSFFEQAELNRTAA